MADAEGAEGIDGIVEQLVDIFVYAPLGLAMTARESLPGLVEKGRQQFQSQAAVARMMGTYAVEQAEKDARKRLGELSSLLAALGVVGPPSASPGPSAGTTGAAGAPAPPASPASSNGKATPSTEPVAPKATPPPAPPSDHLAIPGYDSLSASQVVQRLAGLAPDELDAVREYEEATRGRRTILSKIGQLEADARS